MRDRSESGGQCQKSNEKRKLTATVLNLKQQLLDRQKDDSRSIYSNGIKYNISRFPASR